MYTAKCWYKTENEREEIPRRKKKRKKRLIYIRHLERIC